MTRPADAKVMDVPVAQETPRKNGGETATAEYEVLEQSFEHDGVRYYRNQKVVLAMEDAAWFEIIGLVRRATS